MTTSRTNLTHLVASIYLKMVPFKRFHLAIAPIQCTMHSFCFYICKNGVTLIYLKFVCVRQTYQKKNKLQLSVNVRTRDLFHFYPDRNNILDCFLETNPNTYKGCSTIIETFTLTPQTTDQSMKIQHNVIGDNFQKGEVFLLNDIIRS